MQVADSGRRREQVEQQRRRDVVGQVAHHAQPLSTGSGERREVETQRIRPVQRQALRRVPLTERRGEVAVDLDGIEATGGFEQRRGERAMAGADLHQCVAGPRSDGLDDAVYDPRVVQEMLAETLAGEHHRRSAAAAVAVVRAGDVGGPSAPSHEVSGERDGGAQAAGVGAASAGERERGAVVDRGAQHGKA